MTAPAGLCRAVGLLPATATTAVHRAAFEAVGNLAGVVGFIAFDVADHAAARRLFAAGLRCAAGGRSWSLRAALLADVARLHSASDEFDDALSAIEFAQVRGDRLTATARAVLAVMRAQILAAMGRRDHARTAVDFADEEFARREPGQDPPWLTYYDEAEHAGSTARALLPLDLRAGRPGVAADRLVAAIESQSSSYPRSRAFSAVRLASLQMQVGDPREAVAASRAALAGAETVRSRRLNLELDGLRHACRPHLRLPEVADLAAELDSR